MSRDKLSYNLDGLISLSAERQRVVHAVEEAQWQDDWETDYNVWCRQFLKKENQYD